MNVFKNGQLRHIHLKKNMSEQKKNSVHKYSFFSLRIESESTLRRSNHLPITIFDLTCTINTPASEN